ncbi:MAG: hypothetical protein EOO29_27620 [Comamonadaceae bacterium]|nr:MAG: hypothetical protein EOO29_27620 [Comamonadaceae bacterium]
MVIKQAANIGECPIPAALPTCDNVCMGAKDRSRGYIAVWNAFTGEDRYYAERWRPLANGTSRLAGFNDSVLLFGSLWFFARRMPGLGLLVLAASTLLMFAGYEASAWLLDDGWPSIAPPPVLHLLVAWVALVVLLHLPLGLAANRIYYARAREVIAEASLRAASRPELLEMVAERGGLAIKSIARSARPTGAAALFDTQAGNAGRKPSTDR